MNRFAVTSISVIIPTLNAGASLSACLEAAVAGGRPAELIVSDCGSTDDTLAIANKFKPKIVSGPQGRGQQLSLGAQSATGEWLLFLHADSHLPPDWLEVAERHIASSSKPAAFRLAFRACGFAPKVVAMWANLRSRAGLPYGDQGLLISAAQYRQVGGYPKIALMEDVAMVRILPAIKLLQSTVQTSADRYEREGWLRRSVKNGDTLLRYFLGVSPEVLAKNYGRDPNL